MSLAFKGRHFAPDIILLCMRWYCRYALSYRDLEEMMAERGLSVDHTTIYRWVQHYAPELDRRVQWCRNRNSGSWYVDETYVKVRGEWMYLYRAIGDRGETLDFQLSQKRTTKAAKRFLVKALNRSPHNRPSVISTDKNPAYNEAIASLRREGRLAATCQHRQIKYLNNRLESDHGKLKQRIRPVRGFQSQKTAHNAIRGFETMRMFRKGQFRSMVDSLAGGSEARFIGRLFQVFVA
ncbi:IS6 family transposase [Aureimonas pseudogalii]|uniref:Transposase-like protein n=1 Tax=Aureimonas pseudogalii TaxID=1744844 RepID=A0A7W6MLX7_9HYPH|nr:IS6 family transposase [Aureimonas pseudogalii]MBB4000275.1 transposase-like protein [Aureimonas pseudogalii]